MRLRLAGLDQGTPDRLGKGDVRPGIAMQMAELPFSQSELDSAKAMEAGFDAGPASRRSLDFFGSPRPTCGHVSTS
jgi:hypothetical protein